MASPERVEAKQERGEKKESFGMGWKVLAGLEAVALAAGREYLGLGQKRGEAAENRSTGEFIGDVAKTSAQHLEGLGKLLDVVESLDERDTLRELERAVEDAPDEESRMIAQQALEQRTKEVTRSREDRQAMAEGLKMAWEALTGPGKRNAAA